jgi:hypothetical protein
MSLSPLEKIGGFDYETTLVLADFRNEEASETEEAAD